jgi:YbbR domain-containing protein
MPLRRLIANQFWLKLLSLVLACLIWLTVRANIGTTSGDATRTFEARPVLLLTDSAEHVAMVASPSKASVTVRGPAALVQELAENDVHVYLRLADSSVAGGQLPIHAHVPAGVSVMLVTPATAAVRPASTR